MKMVAIIIFDNFTDIDLFLMWDILGRYKQDWQVRILGTKPTHKSYNGLPISTHGNITEANSADVVLFSSGKGTRDVIKDMTFINAFKLDEKKQIIGSICSGALILATLGLLNGKKATTHPRAKSELQALGIDVVDLPFVCNGNIATAGGCLAAQYLVGWVINNVYGAKKKNEMLGEIFPVGQKEEYQKLLDSSIEQGYVQEKKIVSDVTATFNPSMYYQSSVKKNDSYDVVRLEAHNKDKHKDVQKNDHQLRNNPQPSAKL